MTIFYTWAVFTLVATLSVRYFYNFRFEVYKRAASESASDEMGYNRLIEKQNLSLDRSYKFPILTSFISIILFLTVISPKFGLSTELINRINSNKFEDSLHYIVITLMILYSLLIFLASIPILIGYLSEFYSKIINSIKFNTIKENIIKFFVKKTLDNNEKISNNIKKPDNSRI